jgi:hypothetical protein
MSKPDDIPQDVWDKAQAVESDCISATWNGPAKGTRTISETIIARAIMSAEKRGEERERAACELVAQDWTGGAEYIAAEIRKRGEG